MPARTPASRAPLTHWATLAAGLASGLAAGPLLADPPFEYAHDDGSGYIESSLALYDARVTWGNVFQTQSPWSTLIGVEVSFGGDVMTGKPIQIGIWADPTPNADPRDATLIALSAHTVPHPTGPEDFVTFDIHPTPVSGAFFVGVIADLKLGEVALRQDDSTLGTRSWRFDNPIGTDNFDLGNAGYSARPGDFGFGTWMVRAVAVPGPGGAGLLGLGLSLTRRRRR